MPPKRGNVVPLVGDATMACLLPKLAFEPSVEHLAGMVGARTALACRAQVATTRCVEMGEGDASDASGRR